MEPPPSRGVSRTAARPSKGPKALRLAKNPALLYHLGVVDAEMGKKRDAALDKALLLSPEYRAAREERREPTSATRS
jgi:hypothetical protein